MRPVIVVGLGLALSGCATQWTNPQYSSADEPAHLTADTNRCKRVARGRAPMPAVSFQQSPSSYSVTGRATTFDYSTGGYSASTYSGTVVPQQNFASGMAQGMANGAALAAIMDANDERDAILAECMTALGWVDKSDAKSVERRKAALAVQSDQQSLDTALASVPRLAMLRRVDPEAFNRVAKMDTELRDRPEWKQVALVTRFEAVTRAYEDEAGRLYLADEPAPSDTAYVRERQASFRDGMKIAQALSQQGDSGKAAEMLRALNRIESEIYTARLRANAAGPR